jgi:hypothetical protein
MIKDEKVKADIDVMMDCFAGGELGTLLNHLTEQRDKGDTKAEILLATPRKMANFIRVAKGMSLPKEQAHESK